MNSTDNRVRALGITAAVVVALTMAAAPASADGSVFTLRFETAALDAIVTPVPRPIYTARRLEGTLSNIEDGCYSLWVGPESFPSKRATVCGTIGAPVDVTAEVNPFWGSAIAVLCTGAVDLANCGPRTKF